jgi:hypothetical protein
MFFLNRDRNKNIFDWNPHPKFVSDGPGPRPKTFFRRDRDRYQNFFLTGTGTKNDLFRSCLIITCYRESGKRIKDKYVKVNHLS